MRILYISSSCVWGGATKALVNLLKGLHNNHDIRVLCPTDYGRLCDELDELNIKYYKGSYGLTLIPNTMNPIKKVLRISRMLIKIKKTKRLIREIIMDFHPDIVHTNVGPLDLALDECLRAKIPHVWHIREYQDKDFNMHFFPSKLGFINRLHKDGNYNIAITKGVYNYFRLRPKDKVIYDGVFNAEDAKNAFEKEKYFLFVGRIEEAKGALELLSAFSKFCNSRNDYKLLIAGKVLENTLYVNKCIKFLKSNNLELFVEFLGDRKDIYELMSKATALIVPSRFEGFGFITAEAMLNDCLVIGRNTAGTKEQMDNGLLQVNSEIALRFSSEDELLQRMNFAVITDTYAMRQLAKTVVLSNYTIDIYSNKVEEFYNEIIKLNMGDI